jgi:hypothetical protein
VPPEDDPRGLKHVVAKNTKTKVQIVISCAFNNKKLVHSVGIIIVLNCYCLFGILACLIRNLL